MYLSLSLRTILMLRLKQVLWIGLQGCVWGNFPYEKLWNHLDSRGKRDLRWTSDVKPYDNFLNGMNLVLLLTRSTRKPLSSVWLRSGLVSGEYDRDGMGQEFISKIPDMRLTKNWTLWALQAARASLMGETEARWKKNWTILAEGPLINNATQI